jgi:hypothetical protein
MLQTARKTAGKEKAPREIPWAFAVDCPVSGSPLILRKFPVGILFITIRKMSRSF